MPTTKLRCFQSHTHPPPTHPRTWCAKAPRRRGRHRNRKRKNLAQPIPPHSSRGVPSSFARGTKNKTHARSTKRHNLKSMEHLTLVLRPKPNRNLSMGHTSTRLARVNTLSATLCVPSQKPTTKSSLGAELSMPCNSHGFPSPGAPWMDGREGN